MASTSPPSDLAERTTLLRMHGDLRPRVLLASMPFVSFSGPSPALSQLKPQLVRSGIDCDIYYGSLAFREFCGERQACDRVAKKFMLGDWIFGPALFDDDSLPSNRHDEEALCEALPAGDRGDAARDAKRLAAHARSFLAHALERVDWGGYDVVGFTSTFAQNTASLALARAIKERWPRTVVALGGANALGAMGRQLMRRFPFVDWIVNGEGEVAFTEAVQRLFAGESVHGIAGLTYRRADGEFVEQGAATPADLDDLPHPDFEDYFDAVRRRAPELESELVLPLEMSRGCWWGDRSKCTFCGLNPSVTRYRQKSPERAIAEVETVVLRYGVNRLRCLDNNVPRRFFRDVFPAVAERVELDALFVETMPTLSRDELSILAAAGTRIFQPGIESLDSAHLRLMKKGTTMLHNVQLLKWARELNVRVFWNLLHGFPGEEPAFFERMTGLVPALTHLEPPAAIVEVVVQPFSPLFDEAGRHGVRNVRPKRAYTTVYPFDESELYELAYAHDFEREESERLRAASSAAITAVEAWKRRWEEGRADLLGFVGGKDGRVKIHDTRAIRPTAVVELEGQAAAAYLACDRRRTVSSVARLLRESSDGPEVTLAETTALLDDLVDRHLMVRDGASYLSLACDLGRMDRHAASSLATLLVRLGELAPSRP